MIGRQEYNPSAMNGLHADNFIRAENGLYIPDKKIHAMEGGFQALDGMEPWKKLGGGGGGSNVWDDVPGMCFLLDAANSSSYSGSGQTWANLVPSPADGESQTEYDFYRGDTSSSEASDPTFTGTAGVAGAYWSYDSGDFHRIITTSVPTFLLSAHHTSSGNTSWLAWCGRMASSGNRVMFSQMGTNTNGIEILNTPSGGNNNLLIVSRHPSYNAWLAQSGAKTAGVDYLFIAAYKRNGSTNEVKMWYNTRTAATPTVTTGGTTTNNAVDRATIGARTNGTVITPTPTRCYGMAGGNDDMNDTLAGYIFDYFNASTGITFA